MTGSFASNELYIGQRLRDSPAARLRLYAGTPST